MNPREPIIRIRKAFRVMQTNCHRRGLITEGVDDMKIEIKNRLNGNIILCGEYESIKDCLKRNRGADLSGADLRGAYLRGADLSGTDLSDADLNGTDLRGAYLNGAYLSGAYLNGTDLNGADYNGEKLDKEPIQLLGLKYFILITKEQIKIGCELHKASEWKEFDDKRIIEMDGKEALKWWKEHKDLILKAHELHCK